MQTDDQHREDAVKALHLLLHHRWNTTIGPADDEALHVKAAQFVDAAVATGEQRLVMLTVGSQYAAETLATAVVRYADADAEPTQDDFIEALRVIDRMANHTPAP
jgi:hypothetical protein